MINIKLIIALVVGLNIISCDKEQPKCVYVQIHYKNHYLSDTSIINCDLVSKHNIEMMYGQNVWGTTIETTLSDSTGIVDTMYITYNLK